MADNVQLEKIIPNLKNKGIEPAAEIQIELAVRRIYEYIDIAVFNLKRDLQTAITQGKLPSSDLSKISSLLETNDGLKKVSGAFAPDGYITINDNAGHTIKILTTS